MSEVEKMYEKVGVKKLLYCDICKAQEHALRLCAETKCEPFYPPFTAGKQLKILCFIVNKKHSVTFHDQVLNGDKLTLEKIQENLAWAINRIWKDITEEEKEQIRSILNG